MCIYVCMCVYMYMCVYIYIYIHTYVIKLNWHAILSCMLFWIMVRCLNLSHKETPFKTLRGFITLEKTGLATSTLCMLENLKTHFQIGISFDFNIWTPCFGIPRDWNWWGLTLLRGGVGRNLAHWRPYFSNGKLSYSAAHGAVSQFAQKSLPAWARHVSKLVLAA